MLKTVAAKVRDIFGESTATVWAAMSSWPLRWTRAPKRCARSSTSWCRRVDEAGYSVAVGTATHSAGGIDMEVLVKSAETRMYLAKEEHYRLAGKTRG